ncbi:MAG: hypothetical protein AAF353_12275 [Pseudomonadota bacterium]
MTYIKSGFVLISLVLTAFNSALAGGQLLKSAGALAFDNGNTLFVGDSKAGKVHAFELNGRLLVDQSSYQLGRAQTFEGRTIIDGIDKEIGGLLGIPADQVQINDMVVHKKTRQIFISVHRGLGPNAEAVILQVDKGELNLVNLRDAKHSYANVGPVPSDETLEFGQPLNQLAITDIDYYKGEIFVAGLSNEAFSSKLRRISFPFDGKVKTSSVEIWHAVHAQYETRAPIITQTITEFDGEPTLIAIYACTPVVRIPLAELKDGAKVRGTMIGEMGFGNTPIDIIQFTNAWDKSENVLITNTNRSAAQIPLNAIASAKEMPHGEGVKPVFSVAGVEQYSMPMAGTLHLDTIDETWAVTIRHSPEDVRNVQLHSLPMPFFFDRADHIVEMNWADGPDPFGYKSAPPLQYN